MRLAVKLALAMTALVAAVVVTAIWSIGVYLRRDTERQLAAQIEESVHAMIVEVQKYVPGYRLVNGPVIDRDTNRVSIYLEVEGLGDYLPKYAGNLDIMTASAARTAEMFAEEILAGKLTLEPVLA